MRCGQARSASGSGIIRGSHDASARHRGHRRHHHGGRRARFRNSPVGINHDLKGLIRFVSMVLPIRTLKSTMTLKKERLRVSKSAFADE
jgi:hypothetical protein